MTLYEALDAFKDIRDTAITTESKRKIEPISEDWQSINTNMTLYYNTLSSGDTVAADAYIDEIVTILNGYDLTVDLPIQFPLALSVFYSPVSIQVPVDEFGLNPNYTNAISTISVYVGGIDDSSNWTYVIDSSTNTTAVIQNTNEVKINALTADSGSVVVEASKSGYDTLSITVTVFRYYDAQSGLSINTYPDTIIIPSDSNGDNPVLTDAISTQYVREGVTDETANYTFTIQSQTNVTAVIQNDDEVKINAITADTGSVTVRASRSGRPNYDYDIPIQKQKKGITALDPSSVDEETIKINSSEEGYVARDSDGEIALYGNPPDMVSYLNGNASPIDPGEYIFKSSTLRKAISKNNNGGYNALKHLYSIESPSSVTTYESQGNVAIGAGNILDVSEDDGYEVQNTVYPTVGGTVGNIAFLAGQGDLTAYYTVGSRVLLYAKTLTGNTDIKGVHYYITGTIVTSVFGTITEVAFNTDYSWTTGLSDYYSEITTAGNYPRAVVYTPYDSGLGAIGSFSNFIVGDSNLINGRGQFVIGSYNSSKNGRNTIVFGEGWHTNPTNTSYLGTSGNVLIGHGLSWGGDSDVIKGHANLVIDGFSGNNVIDHEDCNANIVIGTLNAAGEYATPQTYGSRYCTIVGYRNIANADNSIMYGQGGVSTTNGEITSSSSNSLIQKSTFLLEEATSSVSPAIIESLGRLATSSIADPESIQVSASTLLTGTMDIMGVKSTGELFRRKVVFMAVRFAAGSVIIKQGGNPLVTSLSDYDLTEFSPTALTVTGTATEVVVTVTPDAATPTKWTVNTDVTIMDT